MRVQARGRFLRSRLKSTFRIFRRADTDKLRHMRTPLCYRRQECLSERNRVVSVPYREGQYKRRFTRTLSLSAVRSVNRRNGFSVTRGVVLPVCSYSAAAAVRVRRRFNGVRWWLLDMERAA